MIWFFTFVLLEYRYMELKYFFSDLKVVELAAVLAGPSVGMFFAELGAEVIKVENKATEGDMTRRWRNPKESTTSSISSYYSSVNFYKKSIFIDLTDPIEREKVHQLIANADIVIANFKPGSAEKLQMDYPFLKSLNPSLIYAQINGMADGRPAFDVVLQAEAGFISMTGEKEGQYAKMPVALIDLLAAHQLKEAILMALLHKLKTGKGAKLEVSLMDAGLASLANQATNWLMSGFLPQPIGTKHPNIAPYGDVFYSKDKVPFVLAVGTENQWKALCTLFSDKEKWIDIANNQRVKKRDRIVLQCQSVFSDYDALELFELFKSKKIPFGKIKNLDEVFQSDSAQSLLIKEEQEGVNKVGVKSVVFSIKTSSEV